MACKEKSKLVPCLNRRVCEFLVAQNTAAKCKQRRREMRANSFNANIQADKPLQGTSVGGNFFQCIQQTLNRGFLRVPLQQIYVPGASIEIVSGRKSFQRTFNPECRVLRQRPFVIARKANPVQATGCSCPLPLTTKRKQRRLRGRRGGRKCVAFLDNSLMEEGDIGDGAEEADHQVLYSDRYCCQQPGSHKHRSGPLKSVRVSPLPSAGGRHHHSTKPAEKPPSPPPSTDADGGCIICAKIEQRDGCKRPNRIGNCLAMRIYCPELHDPQLLQANLQQAASAGDGCPSTSELLKATGEGGGDEGNLRSVTMTTPQDKSSDTPVIRGKRGCRC